MNIDWTKHPEATHYDNRPGCTPAFMRKNHNGRDWEYLGMGDHWVMYGPISDNQLADLIKRPTEWTGEGLPPAGTVLEWLDKKGCNGWIKCRISYSSDWVIVVQDHRTPGESETEIAISYPEIAQPVSEYLRPIRTPEQIAAEERLKAIDEMAAVYKSNYEGHVKDGCQALYDAGYRKVPRE